MSGRQSLSGPPTNVAPSPTNCSYLFSYSIRGGATPTPAISLPESLKEFIEREVETKGYGNVSEYVRGLLRGAQEREANQRLEALLLEGLAAGSETGVTPGFWQDLRRDAATLLAKDKQPGKARRKK